MGEGAELPALYAQLGKVLRERFLGWRAAVFTGNPDLGKNMGLRAKRYHSLYNGALECRLLHFDIETDAFVSDRPRPLPSADRSPGARMLANRLMKNRRTLEKWCRREQIHCYRLYDADLPEYAFAVDIYGSDERFVHVQEYEPPASVDPKRARRRVREALGVIAEVLEVPEACVFFKVRRRQKGKSQYQRLSEQGDFHEVLEGGLRFLVNLEDYIDTGLFLDHRGIRRFIGELAKGRHFLNLFAYTGTASVYAAHGGALTTTSVDMSATYLDWAKRNLSLNGFRGTDHRLIQADCLRWLRQEMAGRRFGIIFVDPPSYSTSKRMSRAFDVQRDHAELIRDSAKLLEPGGSLIFSNNLRRFRLDEGALDGLEIKDITARTMPRDFARNPGIHHCWHIRIRGPGD
jgi:23S rRNA (guanine2445-N2)-methyltransferase / 23S rRNA (guanine2069-N7)-methyltransferase